MPTSANPKIREMMRKKREEIREERNKLTNSLTSPIVDGGIESKYDLFTILVSCTFCSLAKIAIFRLFLHIIPLFVASVIQY